MRSSCRLPPSTAQPLLSPKIAVDRFGNEVLAVGLRIVGQSGDKFDRLEFFRIARRCDFRFKFGEQEVSVAGAAGTVAGQTFVR